MPKWLKALTGGDVPDAVRFIVVESRFPQALTAVLCGAALAAAGLMMQTIFANPLADPSILGVNAGASLGVAVAMLLLGGSAVACGVSLSGFALTVVAAFAGSVMVLTLLTMLAAVVRSGFVLLIAGIMVGYVVSAAIELLGTLSSAEGLRSYVFWGMGGFGGVSTRVLPVFAVVMIVALLMALAMSKPLNAMLLGENYASNLGISVRHVRLCGVRHNGRAVGCANVVVRSRSFSRACRAPYSPFRFAHIKPPRASSPFNVHGAAVAGACNLICCLPTNGTLIPLNAVTSLWVCRSFFTCCFHPLAAVCEPLQTFVSAHGKCVVRGAPKRGRKKRNFCGFVTCCVSGVPKSQKYKPYIFKIQGTYFKICALCFYKMPYVF